MIGRLHKHDIFQQTKQGIILHNKKTIYIFLFAKIREFTKLLKDVQAR